MTTFIDTSALFAFLNGSDAFHGRALETWRDLSDRDEPFVTHNYVVLETVSLLQARLGMDAVGTMLDRVMPVLAVFWVDEELHERSVRSFRASARRAVSLVDWVSFESMRAHGITKAFAFDPHFGDQGFEVLPAPGES